jgi:hypothetical protein
MRDRDNVDIVRKLWLHHNDDVRGGRLIEAGVFRRKAERLMQLYGITMEQVFPRQKRADLLFETRSPRRVRMALGVIRIAEKRGFVTVVTCALANRPHYRLALEFVGKPSNVDFVIETLESLPV